MSLVLVVVLAQTGTHFDTVLVTHTPTPTLTQNSADS